jgi:hypothetical protein
VSFCSSRVWVWRPAKSIQPANCKKDLNKAKRNQSLAQRSNRPHRHHLRLSFLRIRKSSFGARVPASSGAARERKEAPSIRFPMRQRDERAAAACYGAPLHCSSGKILEHGRDVLSAIVRRLPRGRGKARCRFVCAESGYRFELLSELSHVAGRDAGRSS